MKRSHRFVARKQNREDVLLAFIVNGDILTD